MNPEVSVIMPVYNCKQYILESIKSICNQTYKNWELIIINDSSTENIEEEIKKVHDDRIHYHTFKEYKGLLDVLKYGFKQAKGDFITFHDPDDISAPARFEEQLNHLKANEDLGMVSCLIRCFTNEQSYRNACTFVEKIQNAYITKEEIENAIVNGFSPIIFPTIMIRKSLFSGIEISKEENYIEDYFQVLLYLLKQGRVEKVNRVLYYYRRHKKSYHIQNEKEYLKTVEHQINKSGIQNFIKYRELYNNLKKEQNIDNVLTEDNRLQKYSKLREDSPVRILMLIDALNIGGTEMYVLELAKALVKLGAYVVIGTSGGPLQEVFENSGLKVEKIPFTSDYISNKSIMGLIKLTKKIIDKEKINLLHCNLFASMCLGNAIYRRYKIPYVVTLHGLFYPNDILFASCINAAKIIAVSEPVKKLSELKLGARVRGEILVIPNGIDTDKFRPKHERVDFKKSLGIPENSQIITYCSRLDWGKTLAAEAFVFACYQLMIKNKHLYAIVIGDGADKKLIDREVDLLNKVLKRKAVYMVGAKFNVLPYYQNANIVVGTARVALEAMSCGKPVIAVGNQGYTGIITYKNEKEQWNMYFGDHGAIKKADNLTLAKDLDSLLESPEKCGMIGKWGRSWCKENFNNSIIAKNILKLYKEVLFGKEEKKERLKEEESIDKIEEKEFPKEEGILRKEKEIYDKDEKKKTHNHTEIGIQVKERLLVEKTSIIVTTFSRKIKFTPEVSEILFDTDEAIVRYCNHCSHRRLCITIPFTIVLKDKNDPCKVLKVHDLLHLEFNNCNCNNCQYKQNGECGTLVKLKDKHGIKIENKMKNKPFIDKCNRRIVFEIVTRICVDCCDPGISNLETGIYGSSSIIDKDNPPIKFSRKHGYEKNAAAKAFIKVHHDLSYCFTDENCDYKAHSCMKKYPSGGCCMHKIEPEC